MSFTNPPVSFVQQYGSTVQMMAQQMQSRLFDKVRRETVVGKRHYFDLYDTEATMNVVSNRFSDIQPTDTNFQRRAVDMVDYDSAKFLDNFDALKTLIDPQSPVVMAQAAQAARQIDTIIINAAFANALAGETGSQSVSFPAGQVVALNSWNYGTGSGNANLTISKIIEAAALMDANEVPADERYLVVDPINHSKLLATAEATSSDFVTARSLETGEINGLVGFRLIKSTLLPTESSGTVRRCFAFQRTGLALAVGQDVKADISQLKHKTSQPIQCYYSMSMGATRLEEKKVVEIKCLAS